MYIGTQSNTIVKHEHTQVQYTFINIVSCFMNDDYEH